jgi:hypothetical protein
MYVFQTGVGLKMAKDGVLSIAIHSKKLKCYMHHFKCAVTDCSLKCSLEVTQSAGMDTSHVHFLEIGPMTTLT